MSTYNTVARRGRTARFAVLASVAIVAATATFDASGRVSPTDGPPSMKVEYGDLDLANERGQHTLKVRIQRAARIVCGDVGSADLMQEIAFHACVEQAAREALQQVKWRQLRAGYLGTSA